jgi:FkbM family methyltransferase
MSFWSYLTRRLKRPPVRFDEVLFVDKMMGAITKGVMVDVGAHFGESLQPFAKRGWRIVAFEPDTHEGKHAAIKVRLNERSDLFTCALSNSEAESSAFYVSKVSTGISGLLPFHPSHTSAARVPVRTLRGVLSELGIDRVNFLKIDTEGNDLLVLQGLDWAVRPDVILCEFEDSKTKLANYDYRNLGDYLMSGGYRVFVSEWYPIKRYGVEHSWRRLCSYPCKLKDTNAWGNFIAVVPERADEFLTTVKSFGVRSE